jgi:hypothetical protein
MEGVGMGDKIGKLFSNKIDRHIEEVIKVDQTDETVLGDEISEYVPTDAIKNHFADIFEKYAETPNKPHEGIAVWISGFFGSGKSSFAKILGLAIANRNIQGKPAADRFLERTADNRLTVLLKTINEKIPTHAVIFDVSTDRGIRSGEQKLTEIMYGLFLQSLGYAKDFDLAELEIGLEEQGRLAAFEAEYRRLFDNKAWNTEKGKIAFSLSQASRVMHSLEPNTYPAADSWVKAAKGRAEVTTNKFAEIAGLLMQRRKPGHALLFVIDEVGQFVARDVQKMLDLQAIVQSMGAKGRGKYWVAVTSQEKLGEIVSGLDDRQIELARLMDRFPSQVHLEPSDISEVTSRRILSKTTAARAALGKLFDEHRGRLTDNTKLSADIRLPELSRDLFIDLYPLLPYQIDLIIQVVSGLRTQGGVSRHVGGANRTIIKLAQQLLIHPAVNLAEQPLGSLARLDQMYDLVENNIGSDIRAKIASIPREISHPLAGPVAKAVCLLQFVKSIHRTADNIAAVLYPAVGAGDQRAEVAEALRALEAAHMVRLSDDGYRIPTPAEDDWEKQRNAVNPQPGDAHRLFSEVMMGFWQVTPSWTMLDTKNFKAGLSIRGREVVSGDVRFNVYADESGQLYDKLRDEMRRRSQEEKGEVFWAVPLNDAIDRETVEVFRSQTILQKKEREARTATETALVAEEKVRQRRHSDELKRLLKEASLAGAIYFRGNDRSPSHQVSDVAKCAADVLSRVIPDVYDRFKEAAIKPTEVKRGLETLLQADSLRGLPTFFANLGLTRVEQGGVVIDADNGPLAEALRKIENRVSYGETANGKFLEDEFKKEPFGWDFDAVKLLALCLLRSGRVEAVSKGQVADTVREPLAQESFTNNNLFRQTAFRPKVGLEFPELVSASQHFQETFGSTVRELTAACIAAELRAEISRREGEVADAQSLLTINQLPGAEVPETALGQMRAILSGSDNNAVLTFNTAFRTIKDGIKRAAEITQALTEPRMADLRRARTALEKWSVLAQEPGLDAQLAVRAEELTNLLGRETFYNHLSAIEQYGAVILAEYSRLYEAALAERISAYQEACGRLTATAGWEAIGSDEQERISRPLRQGADQDELPATIAQLRSDKDACEARLKAAIQEVHRLIEGERLVTLRIDAYFSGGIETEEQLESALQGIREALSRLIGEGKKVIVQ